MINICVLILKTKWTSCCLPILSGGCIVCDGRPSVSAGVREKWPLKTGQRFASQREPQCLLVIRAVVAGNGELDAFSGLRVQGLICLLIDGAAADTEITQKQMC